MPSPFDGLAASITGAVSRVMGYAAIWSPTSGAAVCQGRVLFKEPTAEQKLEGIRFDPEKPTAELLPADFPGLYEAARAKSNEILVIEGRRYGVRAARALHDGRTVEVDMARLPDAP
jgi:hypothetical protein